MSSEAIAAIGAQMSEAGAAKSPGAAIGETVQLSDISAGNGLDRSAEAFSNVMSDVHTNVEKFKADPAAGVGTMKADPVKEAKVDLLPSPWVLHPAKSGEKPPVEMGGNQEMVGVLSKSFDHAIFLSLVSQVVGGLSHTTSSLIRQA
ncbi:MAG: hypothetical protein KDJ16_00390 [Hyphomicrobiales bacterium]|nr:hypothetical protein [Hyphomicrobiales bacterium]